MTSRLKKHAADAVRLSMISLFALTAACGGASAEPETISPGDDRFNMPEFEDFEVEYTSSFSKTGAFVLQVRNLSDGAKVHVMDIIPGKDAVVVAFRQIDTASQRVEFNAGPYFAWGQEYVVRQSSAKGYDMTRIPVGGGAPEHVVGALPLGGYVADTFSPTLASLMPMETGTKFRLPIIEPRVGGTVENVAADFEVIGRETLELASGVSCECWVIEEKTSAMTSRLWVSREAPFVYRWQRDIGGEREFISEALSFRPLPK